MAVYKRGGIYWWDFVYAGKRYQESTKAKRKTLAVECEKRRKRELEETYTSGRIGDSQDR